jgi:hypothetical protein
MMTVAPHLVLFSNPENTDPTYSRSGSSYRQDSPPPLSTHAGPDVLVNVHFARAVVGDVGTIRSLWSAAHHKLPVMAVLINDGGQVNARGKTLLPIMKGDVCLHYGSSRRFGRCPLL